MFNTKRFHSSGFILVLLSVTLLMLMSLVLGCGTETAETVVDIPYEEEPAPAPEPAPLPEPEPAPQPTGIPWDQAKSHIGERITVYGPVASTHYATGSRGKPTFINLGNAHPDPNRFTALIWDQSRANFPFAPENQYRGKTISVYGLITEYEGVPQIEVTSPDQIEIW